MQGMASKLYWKPCLYSISLILPFIYIPGILGASIPWGWFHLFILIPVLFLFVQFKINSIHIYGLLFLLYATLSLLWTVHFNIGFFILLQLIVLGMVFCIGSALDRLDTLFKFIAIGLLVSVIVFILQKHFNFKAVYYNSYPAGLFVNKNIFCEVSVVVFLALLVYKLWWWIPITVPGIVYVHSRGAILGLFVGIVAWIWSRDKWLAIALFAAGIFISSLYLIDVDASSFNERLIIWKDTIVGLTIFGNGVGSFEILYPLNAKLDTFIARPRYAHNDLLHLIFEFGIGTLFLIPVIFTALFNKSDERVILYGIGIISLFSYPFHVPVLAYIGCLVAGYVVRNNGSDWIIRLFGGWVLLKRITAK